MSENFCGLMFYNIYQANFMIYYCSYDCAEDGVNGHRKLH